ncbi:MAG: AAA family ATPase [Planctomycetota bacterium]
MSENEPTPERGAPGGEKAEQARRAIEAFRADYGAVREQVGRAVVGNAETIDLVLTGLFAGGHVLLEGVPGIGKTLLIRSLAQALRLEFGRIQFTPDLMPADIVGTTVVREVEAAGGRTSREFMFEKGPVFAQMVLADEINRATPKTQAALLEAMQERSVTVSGTTRPLPAPFFVMATQNPIEQEGTYPLPEAQLDRFFFKLIVGYASRADLGEILDRTTRGSSEELEPVLDAERLVSHQALVRRVAIADHVQDFAVRCVLATHAPTDELGAAAGEDTGRFATPMVRQYVRVGASPRAAQSIVLGAKCRALVDGRAAASIDDVKAVALPALRHRVLVNFEAQAEGVTSDAVLLNMLETLPLRSDA